MTTRIDKQEQQAKFEKMYATELAAIEADEMLSEKGKAGKRTEAAKRQAFRLESLRHIDNRSYLEVELDNVARRLDPERAQELRGELASLGDGGFVEWYVATMRKVLLLVARTRRVPAGPMGLEWRLLSSKICDTFKDHEAFVRLSQQLRNEEPGALYRLERDHMELKAAMEEVYQELAAVPADLTPKQQRAFYGAW